MFIGNVFRLLDMESGMESSHNINSTAVRKENWKLKLVQIIFFAFLFSIFQYFLHDNNNRNIFYTIGGIFGNALFYGLSGFIPAFLIKIFSWRAPIYKFFRNALILNLIIGAFLTLGNIYNYFQYERITNNYQSNFKNLSNEKDIIEADKYVSYVNDNVYKIEKYLTAYFLGKPKFSGDVNTDKFYTRSYSYTDELNLIIYNGTYSVLNEDINNLDYAKVLQEYTIGQIKSLDGELIDKKIVKIDNTNAMVFSFTYRYEHYQIIKYNAVLLSRNIFYSWAVQEIIGYSKQSAKTIFYDNLKFIQISK